MANAVDKLFDSVLGDLPASNVGGLDEDADGGPFDDPVDDPDDVVLTSDEDDALDRVDRRPGEPPRIAPLPRDQDEAAEGGVRRLGFEALAFYKSRRHIQRRPYPGLWGIFYLKPGLTKVAAHIAAAHPGYGDPRQLAKDFLRVHERFHFRADLQALMFEAVSRRHLHAHVRRLFRGRKQDFVEEALANRQVLDWAKRPAVSLEDFARDFMSLQPGAYARFDEPRLELAGEWAANVLDLNIREYARRPDLAHWVEASPDGLTRRSMCPEYVVSPARLSAWWPAALVPPAVNEIIDGDAVLKYFSKSKDTALAEKWSVTKARLVADRFSHGLNFKPWRNEAPAWSVRVDHGYRAHLSPEGGGRWCAYKIGSHEAMGHG